MRHQARALLSATVLASLFSVARARATDPDEKTQCIAASDQGQQLRDDGKFKLARDAFTRCSRATCPGIVRQECGQWLVDLEAKIPTVVIDATDNKGNDLVSVKMSVDGTEVAARLDGLPIAVDGGEHVFHYEAAGFPPVEEHVVIRSGEKNRVLKVRFVASAPPLTVVAPAAPAPEASHAGGGIPLGAWIFTGVAVAAFASETYFGLAGTNQYNQDKGTGPGSCAPHCKSSEVSSIRTQFAIADVSLGVGVVSACFAAYFFLGPRPVSQTPATAFDFAPRPGGGVATMSGRF
jgi:hypothetical protein